MKKTLILLFTIITLAASVKLTFAQDSSSSSSIRQKVQQKVQEVLKSPKVLLGSVTDISDTTIQLKPTKGDIRQISVDKTTTKVLNEVGATTKDAQLTDVAIGDFIVAMGYKDANSILDTRRILVITPLSAPSRKSYIGTVTTQTKTTTTIKIKDGSQLQFSLDAKTPILKENNEDIQPGKATDIVVGSKVLISGLEGSKGFTIRKIVILQAQ